MTILKLIFMVLLCVPLMYIAIFFLVRLTDEVIMQDKQRKQEAEMRNRRSRR